ncbi:hypothetical protein LZC95_26290 [Pendulispora brunnea]|uniref:Uncharacterized protein n=1 Tax=Pendulispora brunnea TaxID=2905690 RepID=A0ABZ2JU52_9BACT
MILFVVVYLLAGPDSASVVAGCILAAKLFTLISFVLAASRFSLGDRLFVAWWLLASNMTLLLLKDLFLGQSVDVVGTGFSIEEQSFAVGAMLSMANIASTIAMIMLARAWPDSGLEAVATPSPRQRLLKLAVVPLAVLVFFLAMRENMHHLPPDLLRTIMLVVIPNVADLVCLSLIGPIALTAFWLRGGALSWPWALLALGNAFWLVWDLATSMSHLTGVAAEVLRLLALGYTGSAGLEQWWLLRRDSDSETRTGLA